MEMGATSEIKRIKPEGEVYTCLNCSYKDGWHVSFKMLESKGKAEIYLICPNCHSRFRIGWEVALEQV